MKNAWEILLEISINFNSPYLNRHANVASAHKMFYSYDNRPHEIFMLVIELIMKISSMQISVVACSSYKFSISQVAVTNFHVKLSVTPHSYKRESKMALKYFISLKTKDSEKEEEEEQKKPEKFRKLMKKYGKSMISSFSRL